MVLLVDNSYTGLHSSTILRTCSCLAHQQVSSTPATPTTSSQRPEQYTHKLTQGLCWAGEVLVSPKMVLLMDEISTGLDSSTTFQICSCLRNLAHLRRCTILVSLLQPAPETFALFDDLLLLSEGAGCCCESADVLLRLPVRPSQPVMLTVVYACMALCHGILCGCHLTAADGGARPGPDLADVQHTGPQPPV